MKIQHLKKHALVTIVVVVMHASSIKAQTTYTSPLTITGTGGTLVLGGAGTIFQITNTTTVPSGYTAGAYYSSVYSSLGIGLGPSATGYYSTAFGLSPVASGMCSTASGYHSTASGIYSMAFGYHSTASGADAIALGLGNTASNYCSFALGYVSDATGSIAVASGAFTLASGYCSTSLGYGTSAAGVFSVASGANTSASAYEVVLGRFNLGGGSLNNWNQGEPIFEIGNGSGTSAKSDAMIVYKNGNATFQGSVTVGPGGDIPMFDGTN